MSDIFREVDEALQREKAAHFWKEYGPTVILSVIVLVLSTAAMSGYRAYDGWRDRDQTQKLIDAANVTTNDGAQAQALIRTAEETGGNHKIIALIAAAAAKAGESDFAGAAALYKEAAETGMADADLKDLAAIMHVRASLLAPANDGGVDYDTLLKSVLPVAKNSRSAFQASGKIESAVIYGEGLNDKASALKILDGMDNPSVPESLQEKARALKQVYGEIAG